MEYLKRLLREIHRRFLWQTLAIYSVFAWIAFGVAGAMAEHRNLPEWFTIFSGVLLILGFPIVLLTAYAQRGLPALGRADPTLHVEVEITEEGEDITVVQDVTGLRRLFTWRNAMLGGMAAFTLWAIVAAAWLLLANQLVDEFHEPTTEETVRSEGT